MHHQILFYYFIFILYVYKNSLIKSFSYIEKSNFYCFMYLAVTIYTNRHDMFIIIL